MVFYNKDKSYYVKTDSNFIFLYKSNSINWIDCYSLGEKDYIIDFLGDEYDFDYYELEMFLKDK